MAIGGAIRSFVAGYVGASMAISGWVAVWGATRGWVEKALIGSPEPASDKQFFYSKFADEADWPLHEDERDEGKTPPVKRKKSKEKKGIKKEAEAKSGNKVEARRREWGCWG
ncbi:unnamed protein product [Prunus armeniaca]